MKVFSLQQNKNTSVFIAKNRLEQLLTSDRIQCSPDCVHKLQEDLYHTISKYLEINPEVFNVDLTRSDIHIRFTGE